MPHRGAGDTPWPGAAQQLPPLHRAQAQARDAGGPRYGLQTAQGGGDDWGQATPGQRGSNGGRRNAFIEGDTPPREGSIPPEMFIFTPVQGQGKGFCFGRYSTKSLERGFSGKLNYTFF